jgi:hypothetical protein
MREKFADVLNGMHRAKEVYTQIPHLESGEVFDSTKEKAESLH